MQLVVAASFCVPPTGAAPVLDSVAAVRAVREWNPAETYPASFSGVVTLVDAERGLVVLQDGNDVVALDVGRSDPAVRPGQQVSVKAADSWPSLPETPRYPVDPDTSELLDLFESEPTAQQGYYIARFRGWIHPPATGEYHFSIASDDASQLLLATSASPETRRVVARVTSYTDRRQWLRMPSQRSEPILLEAGRAYYIEAVHQQAGGLDHMSVAWEGPGIPLQVIPGQFLTPWSPEITAKRRDKSPRSANSATRGAILREAWADVTVDDPAMLVTPRKLAGSLAVRRANIEVLGRASWPEPQTLQIGQRLGMDENFRWSRVEGTLVSIARNADRVVLELVDGARRLEVVLPDTRTDFPGHLRGRRVQVQGPGEALWDGDQTVLGRLWLPSIDRLILMPEPPIAEFSRPASIHDLTSGTVQLPEGAAIKVVGKVVQQDGDRLLLRDFGTYRAFTSHNGVDWQPLGPVIDVEMPDSILVGFAVNSRSPETFSEAVFANVAGLPLPLRHVDVGQPLRPGSLKVEGDRFTVSGVGSDIWNTPDQFTFAHAPLEGDATVVARIVSVALADPAARAGIMFRGSLDPYAQFVQLVQSGDPALLVSSVQWRGQTFGKSQHSVTIPASRALSTWLKLERRTSRVAVRTQPKTILAPDERVEVAGYITTESGEPVIVDAAVRPFRAQQEAPSVTGPWRPAVEVGSLLGDSRKWGGYDFFRVRAVVTFCGEVGGRHYWTLQDRTGAVLLQPRVPSKLFNVPAGTLVDAVSNPGWFLPTDTFFVDNVFQLGPAAMPKAIRHPAQYLLPRRGEGSWIELEGVVRSVSGDDRFEVKTGGELFTVAVPGVPRAQLQRFVDGFVRVRGAIVFPNERERLLLVPSLRHVDLVRTPEADPFQRPAQFIGELAPSALLNESRHRTRVSGVVTLASPGLLFVQDGSGAVQVELAATAAVAAGTTVDVAGFPDPGDAGGVVLRHSVVRASVARGEIVPRGYEPGGAPVDADLACHLVRVRATVIERQGDWMELDVAGQPWRAARPANGDTLPALPPGTVIDAAGIVMPAAAQYPWVRSPERQAPRSGPQLLLRSAADVDVVAAPRWWAVRRTLLGAGVLGTVLAAGFGWIQVLRRRIRQRSAQLEATMKKLENEVRMSATLAERERLSGEIHDSVEQGLNGLLMQLETTAELKTCPPEVRSQLQLARNMAAFSRTEVKHAVWELQSPLLANSNLPQAVQKVVTELVPVTLRATVDVKGEPRRLGSAVEHHLLRLVQEAVNNTVKHARAQTLVVEIQFTPDAVEITVRDDGCGFDPKNRHLARLGHFGLSSMRNRANKILGELDITSSPGQGTKVRVRVPAVQLP